MLVLIHHKKWSNNNYFFYLYFYGNLFEVFYYFTLCNHNRVFAEFIYNSPVSLLDYYTKSLQYYSNCITTLIESYTAFENIDNVNVIHVQ